MLEKAAFINSNERKVTALNILENKKKKILMTHPALQAIK